jgi:hypothetical protein
MHFSLLTHLKTMKMMVTKEVEVEEAGEVVAGAEVAVAGRIINSRKSSLRSRTRRVSTLNSTSLRSTN